MYRRAEMRARAESLASTAAFAGPPAEFPVYDPLVPQPADIVDAGIDPIAQEVRAIPPLPVTPHPIAVRPPSARRPPATQPIAMRRRWIAIAAGIAALVAVVWLARPDTPATSQPVVFTPAPSSHASVTTLPASDTAATTPPPTTPAPATVVASSAAAGSSVRPQPQPSSPPPAPVGDPVLRIVTDPPGARVTVDGVGWGETPVVVRHLPPGAKRIRVTKDGYLADERVVSLSSGSGTGIQLKLRRRPGENVVSTATTRPR